MVVPVSEVQPQRSQARYAREHGPLRFSGVELSVVHRAAHRRSIAKAYEALVGGEEVVEAHHAEGVMVEAEVSEAREVGPFLEVV